MRYVAGISDCWWEWRWWWLVCVFCHMPIIIVITIFLSPVLGTFLGSVQSFMRDLTVRVGPFYSPGLWAASANQRPVFRSRDLPWPIRGQDSSELLFVGLKKFYFPVLIARNLTKCGGRWKIRICNPLKTLLTLFKDISLLVSCFARFLMRRLIFRLSKCFLSKIMCTSGTKAFFDLFLTRALGFAIQGKGYLHIQMGWQPMVTRLFLIRSDLKIMEVNLCWV